MGRRRSLRFNVKPNLAALLELVDWLVEKNDL